MRALAELENIRQRSKREIENGKMYALQSFSKSLIPVIDLFEMSQSAIDEKIVTEMNNDVVSNIFKGMNMTHVELLKAVKQHGLESYNPLGEKFNPNFHEAVYQISDAEKEPGTIVTVQKTGYKLNERVLRAAVVTVSK